MRFLHVSDLHLGSPVLAGSDLPSDMEETLQQSPRRALKRMVQYALDRDLDGVMVSGDLYDREWISIDDREFIQQQLQSLVDADVGLYVLGGHVDPLGMEDDRGPVPETATVFSSQKADHVSTGPEEQSAFHLIGQSYQQSNDARDLLNNYQPPVDGICVALLHAAIDSDSDRVPCDLESLHDFESVVYWALGHEHSLRVEGDPPYAASPGTPQPLCMDDPPIGGCLEVTLGEGPPQLRYIPTSDVLWVTRRIQPESDDLPSDVDEWCDLLMREAGQLTEQDYSEWDPTGNTPVDFDVDATDGLGRGFVVRWELASSWDSLNSLREENGPRRLEEQLRERMKLETPFVWTESVRLCPTEPSDRVLQQAREDEVFQQMMDLLDQLTDERAQDLVARTGAVWKQTTRPEELEPDRCWMSPREQERLLRQAAPFLLEQLAEDWDNDVD